MPEEAENTPDVEHVSFKEGDVVVMEGETSCDLYRLLEGTLSIFKGTQNVAQISNKGALVGEMSFFLGDKRSATIIAQDAVTLEKIPKDALPGLLKDDPDFAIAIATSLASKLRNTTDTVSELDYYKEFYDAANAYAKEESRIQELIERHKNRQHRKDENVKEMLNRQSLMSQQIIQPFIEKTTSAAKDFLQSEITTEEPFQFGEKDTNIDAASVVNLIGECKGWYMIGFPKETAIRMTSQFTGQEYEDYSEDVVNFMKELNNIIIGWIVGAITSYSFTISTPTTIFGKEALVKMTEHSPAITIPFHTSLGDFYALIFIEIIS